MAGNVIEFTIRGIDKASGPLGTVSKTAGTVAKSAAGMAAAVVATAGAVTAFTAKVNDSIDRQAKFAARIGQSVTELSAMQHAAELASIPIDQFNMATQRMTRRAAEAAQGTGEAVSALAELGINAKQFTNLGLQDQMGLVADAMANVQNESDRLRLAFKLFDSEGTAMIQMLKDGSPALQAAARDAQFLGVVIGQQAAANAEEFSTQMARVGAAVKGVSMGVAEELTPVLTGMAENFANSIAMARPLIVNFVSEAIQNVATVGVVIGQVYTRISEFMSNVFSAEGFQAFVDGAGQAMGWVIDLFIRSGPILAGSMVGIFKLMWESFAELGKWGLDKVFDLFTGQDVAGSISDVLFKRIPAATAETRATVSAMWSDLGDIAIEEGARASNALIETFGINVELARQQAGEMIAAIERFGEVAEEVNSNVAAQQATFLQSFYETNAQFLAQQQELSMELATQAHDLMMQTIDAVSQAVGVAAVEGGNLLDSLSQIGKQVLSQVIAMLVKIGIQRVVTGAIANAAVSSQASAELAKGAATTYMNAFSSTAAIPIVGPTLAPGVAAASQAAALAGSAAAGAAGGALGPAITGARADGGPVNMGSTYLVGERGPELFTPRTNGNITPNESLGGSGGVQVGTLIVHMFENATNADMILSMPPEEMREVVASKIIPALDALARQGTRPQYLLEVD